jgi:hypothetical protein
MITQFARKQIRLTSQKNFATLVLAEHFEGKLNPNLGSLLTAASQLKDN